MDARQAIIKLHKVRKETMERLIEQVNASELTPEEAAQSLAGAQLKVLEENPEPPVDRDRLLRQSRHDIDSRLPEYTGIIVGRHI